MAKIKFFGALTNIQMLIYTLFHGKSIGEDGYGNKYYVGKPRQGMQKERRWVVYKDEIEASNVPAEWHGWLHYQTDTIPSDNNKYRQKWQKPHLPNQTGTDQAYLPPGHTLRGGQRPKATGDYIPWQPPQ